MTNRIQEMKSRARQAFTLGTVPSSRYTGSRTEQIHAAFREDMENLGNDFKKAIQTAEARRQARENNK